MKHGYGIYKWANGDEYAGDWVDDLQHGNGHLTTTRGNVLRYSGYWQLGKRHGHGRIEYRDGRTYVGMWLYHSRNGEGRMSYPRQDNRAEYFGNWTSNRKHGYGTMKWRNGDMYEGNWRYNSINGFGRHTYGNRVIEGNFLNDNLDGFGRITQHGCAYVGLLRNGESHGFGAYNCEGDEESTYAGEWRNGTRHGWGQQSRPWYLPDIRGFWRNGREANTTSESKFQHFIEKILLKINGTAHQLFEQFAFEVGNRLMDEQLIEQTAEGTFANRTRLEEMNRRRGEFVRTLINIGLESMRNARDNFRQAGKEGLERFLRSILQKIADFVIKLLKINPVIAGFLITYTIEIFLQRLMFIFGACFKVLLAEAKRFIGRAILWGGLTWAKAITWVKAVPLVKTVAITSSVSITIKPAVAIAIIGSAAVVAYYLWE